MRGARRHFKQFAGLVLALAGLATWIALKDNSSTKPTPVVLADKSNSQINRAYGQLPLSFEANQGQFDSQVKFFSRGRNQCLFLTETEALLALTGPLAPEDENARPQPRKRVGKGQAINPQNTVLRMKLVGANMTPKIEGLDDLPGKSNYLIGSNRQQWHTNVPTYAKVQYRDVYPGVNLVYYGSERQLEYDLVVAPGVDPGIIRIAYDGAQEMSLAAQGDLVLRLKSGELRQHQPIIYQEVSGKKQIISGHYLIKENREVGVQIERYDKGKPLIIDPRLIYSTYLGGEFLDEVRAIAVDSKGNAYVTGRTRSRDFPITPGAISTPSGSIPNSFHGGYSDVFVAKVNATGTALIFSTYLGSNDEDEGEAIAVDSDGNIYVAGFTASDSFPITPGAFQTKGRGIEGGIFVTKLNASGMGILYSTLVSGSGSDDVYGMAVDNSQSVYLTGIATSPDFPTTPGAYRGVFQGGLKDAFVVKLSFTGTALLYSTYLGGSNTDEGRGIAVDKAGNAYVTGLTSSTDFPIKNSSRLYTGSSDAFVAKIDPSKTGDASLVYSIYLGGNRLDKGRGIAVDSNGNAYVTGETLSTGRTTPNFPTTGSPLPVPPLTSLDVDTGSDAFVTKIGLSTDGTASILYSTRLSGRGSDQGHSIGVDAVGNVYVTGITNSADFLVASPFQILTSTKSFDLFVAKIDTSKSGIAALVYSTYLGGNDEENTDEKRGAALAVDASGNAYIAGISPGLIFPTLNPLQGKFSGGADDSFIAKISPEESNMIVSGSAANYRGLLAPEAIAVGFGAALANMTCSASTAPLPTFLCGTQVMITDSLGMTRPAPLFFVSQNQVNYQIPPMTAAGSATVTVRSSDGSSSTIGIALISNGAAPGLFTANSSGAGVAAGIAVHNRLDNTQTSELIANPDKTPRLIDLGPPGEAVVLVLFGTGIRNRSSLSAVTATIGGVSAEVQYAGAQPDFVGLDQVNILVPRSLIGSGTVNLVLTVDGLDANTVTVRFK